MLARFTEGHVLNYRLVKMSFVTIVYIENFSKYIQCRRKVERGRREKEEEGSNKSSIFFDT